MKRYRKAAALLAVFACMMGCSSSETKSESPLQMLEKLNSQSSAQSVQEALSALSAATVEGYNNHYQLTKTIEQSLPQTNAQGELVQETWDQKVVSTYMLQDDVLYQVIRSGSVADTPPYVGFVQVNGKTTTQIECSASANEDIFKEGGKYLVSYVDTRNNLSLKDAGKAEISNALLSQLYEPLALMFQSAQGPSFFQDPEFFEFQLTPQDSGYTFSVSLQDLEGYKQAMEESMSDEEIFQDFYFVPDSWQVKELRQSYSIDSNGILKQADTVQSLEFEKDGTTYTSSVALQEVLDSGDTTSSFAFLTDLFEKAADGSLKRGTAVTLAVPIWQ